MTVQIINPTTPSEQTAAEAHELAYAKAIHAIGSLNKKLAENRNSFEGGGSKCWGHVGELNWINEKLNDALGIE